MKKITRRDMGKMGLGLALLASGVSLIGCSKKSLVMWAQTVVTFLEQTLGYFKDLLPSSVANITKAIAVAKDLQAALSADSPNAVDFINQLLSPDGLINKVIDDIGLIGDPEKRKVVSGVLAIASIALMTIATALAQGSGPAVTTAAKTRGLKGVSTVEKIAASNKLIGTLKALRTQE